MADSIVKLDARMWLHDVGFSWMERWRQHFCLEVAEDSLQASLRGGLSELGAVRNEMMARCHHPSGALAALAPFPPIRA